MGWTRAGFAQLLRRHFGQAQMPHLAGLHQPRHGLHGFHYRNAEVTAVQVIQVNGVGAEPLQAAVHRLPHIRRVAPDIRVAGRRGAHQAELGGQLDFAAALLEQPRDQLLVAAAAIDVRRVDEADAGVHRVVQGLQGLGRVHLPVDRGQGHAAEPQGADLRPSPSWTAAAVMWVSIRWEVPSLPRTPGRARLFLRSCPFASRRRPRTRCVAGGFAARAPD